LVKTINETEYEIFMGLMEETFKVISNPEGGSCIMG
jgi:hypothetical protein